MSINNAASMGRTGCSAQEFSWDTKYAGLQVLLSKLLMDNPNSHYASVLKQYRSKAEYFICSCRQKNRGYDVSWTPSNSSREVPPPYTSSHSRVPPFNNTLMEPRKGDIVAPPGDNEECITDTVHIRSLY